MRLSYIFVNFPFNRGFVNTILVKNCVLRPTVSYLIQTDSYTCRNTGKTFVRQKVAGDRFFRNTEMTTREVNEKLDRHFVRWFLVQPFLIKGALAFFIVQGPGVLVPVLRRITFQELTLSQSLDRICCLLWRPTLQSLRLECNSKRRYRGRLKLIKYDE